MFNWNFDDTIDENINTHQLWVFAQGIKDFTRPMRSEEAVMKRLSYVSYKGKKYIKIKRLETDRDPFNAGLNSRTELRLQNTQLQPNTAYTIHYDFMLKDIKQTATLFQILSRPEVIEHKAGPLLQVEIRNGHFSIRGWACGDFRTAGKQHHLFEFQPGMLYKTRIEFLGAIGGDGYLRVFVDDKLVYENTEKTIDRESPSWIQTGVYHTDATAQYINRLSVQETSKIPKEPKEPKEQMVINIPKDVRRLKMCFGAPTEMIFEFE